MSAPSGTLVGTVHLDPQGEARLVALLRALAPEAVTLEVSAYAVAFRREHGPRLLARLAPFRDAAGALPSGLQAVAAQLEVPFEVRAAQRHGAETGVEAALLGDDAESRALLARLEEEVLTPRNLAHLAQQDVPSLEEQVAAAWARARRDAARAPARDSAAERWLTASDSALAGAIRSRIGGACRWIHVGGHEHLPGLTALLTDLAPQAVLLVDG